MSNVDSLTITRPDDWHVHLRDGGALKQTVKDVARYFGRAIVMPNLVPPVTSAAEAEAYCNRIMVQVPVGSSFKPLMTLYLTGQTTPQLVQEAKQSKLVKAFKLYPAGATTNAESGITSILASYPVFAEMEKLGIPLLIHGEVTDDNVDVFDREAVFIERYLAPLTARFPGLKIVLEHITTRLAVEFVKSTGPQLAATITAHHLLYNRNHMLTGGMKPLYYCLPILKRREHQQALIEAATSGNPGFFLGTDSAPHPRSAKENNCGCAAGSYTAHAAIELYAEVFDSTGKLEKLEGFASHFGADFYGLPRNQDTIQLVKKPWRVPETLELGDQQLIPIRSGELIAWQVVTAES
jgi:dihydroorotase